jgi:hypothetical protein
VGYNASVAKGVRKRKWGGIKMDSDFGLNVPTLTEGAYLKVVISLVAPPNENGRCLMVEGVGISQAESPEDLTRQIHDLCHRAEEIGGTIRFSIMEAVETVSMQAIRHRKFEGF